MFLEALQKEVTGVMLESPIAKLTPLASIHVSNSLLACAIGDLERH